LTPAASGCTRHESGDAEINDLDVAAVGKPTHCPASDPMDDAVAMGKGERRQLI